MRTSRISSWSRSRYFIYAVRATAIVIAILIVNALISFTVILSRIDILQQNSALRVEDICPSRQRYILRDELGSNSNDTHRGISSFAVVLTVNSGFWDFFVNWDNHFQDRVVNKSDELLLVIIAQDADIYDKLKTWPKPKASRTIIIPVYDLTKGSSASARAEDYDSVGYKSLVSSRATYLLNVMCSIQGGKPNKGDDDLVILYSDIDTVWLKDPFPYIQTKLFGSNNNDTDMQHRPNYDILAAVDDDEYNNVSPYYCTGYLVIAQTPASIAFLSLWEEELISNPQLNQPVFNTLLRSPKIPGIRLGDLGQTEFPPGRLYFDEWAKGSREVEKRKKMETMVVHNNYIVGHDAKRKRFQEHGLWMNNMRQL